LSQDECLGLLAHATIGRIGVVIDGYPVILPVNYALDGDLVTIRTAPGGKFDAAQHGKVSFQADQIMAPGRSAWSVLVLGVAAVPDTDDPATVERLHKLQIAPLDPGDKPLWLQIVPERVTGRRVSADESGLMFDVRGYL
jgi:nitroimidazol reductase NimA-like FMN-containing flavoprotein (pyridoxamine 5'-phosphate oxidase superfamily)